MKRDKHKDFDVREYYKNLHLNKDIIFLYLNRILIQISVGMVSVFTAVFFYEEFGQRIAPTMLVFAAFYLLGVLLNPWTAALLKKFGMKKMLIIATTFLPFANLALMLWDKNPSIAVVCFVVFIVLYRTLYWAPYHIDFAKFTDKEGRGKQMSALLNVSEVILTLTPILAGIIIVSYGFSTLFAITVVFTTLSIVPLFFIKETYEEYSFGYFETFRKVFEPENRSMAIANFGDGIQTGTRIAIWPLFIFIVLEGEYVAIGIVTSLTVFLLIALRFVVGNLEDKMDRIKLLKFGSFLSTTGWILKVFVESGFQIFIVDTYHKLGRMVNRMTFDITSYDQASDNGHYIDEFTVLREVATGVGRGVVVLLAIPLVTAFGLTATFIFAAGATVLMSSLKKDVFIQ